MIREAARLEAQHGDPSYGVALVRGQVLTHLGQQEQALVAFQTALNLATEADRPYANHELGVALLDLDNFKRLNDTYGHMAGDAALKHLVKVVRETLRSMDVIARFGGEEFLILLPETTVDAAAAAMVRVQRELTRHFFLHDNEKMLITFSCGVALRVQNEEQASLMARADKAMYQAKSSGKNRVVVAE